MSDSLWSEDDQQKDAELKALLDKVEEKYIHLFVDHPNNLQINDIHDRLINHYSITYDPDRGIRRIDYPKSSYLPKHVQEECTKLFVDFYRPDKKI